MGPAREIDQSRRPAKQRRAAYDKRRVREARCAIGERHEPAAMHMRINTSRHDDLTSSIDQAACVLRLERSVPSDRHDLSTGHAHLERANALRRHYVVALD